MSGNFISIVFLLLSLVGALYGFKRIVKAFRKPAFDYTFGNKDIQVTGLFIRNKKFHQAEIILDTLDSDNLTQCLDHLGISMSLKELQVFHENSENKALGSLVLGVYYSHLAWKIRSNAYASEVSEKNAEDFLKYLSDSGTYLNQALNDQNYAAEAHSRLIRVEMGRGNRTVLKDHFIQCKNRNPLHLWNYLHYAEAVQPKWGAGAEELNDFMHELPENKWIKTIVHLKLMNDGLVQEENYLQPEMDFNVFKEKAIENIRIFDSDASFLRIDSIHKYVFFGYMYSIAEICGDKNLSKKYLKMINGRYALYPFGIL